MADFSTYEGRQAFRDANPGAIVDASGAYYPSSGQTVSGSSPTVNAQPSQGSQAQQLAAGINLLAGAMSSGNKEAFNEAVRQFNVTFGLDQQKFGEAVRQFNQNYLVSEAGLTGTYQGGQTQQAQLQAQNIAAQNAGLTGYYQQPGVAGPGQQTLAAQQQQYAQQLGLINSAAALQANPFRQQQALGQMSRVLGGQGVAGFQAPNVVQGVGVAGGNTGGGMGYLSQMIDDIRDPSANTASMNQVMQGIPTPNKINSTEFLRAAPSTQSMVLQGMQEKYGLDPNDALTQIKATLPAFSAPTTMGTVKR